MIKVETLQIESLFTCISFTSVHEAANRLVGSSYVILPLSDWLIVHQNRIRFVCLTATNNPVLVFFKLKLSNPE